MLLVGFGRVVGNGEIDFSKGESGMRNGTLIMAALLMCNGIVYAQSEAEIRDRIVGTWKLVSTEQTLKDGTTRPYPQFGPHGKGFIMYSRDGYLCADLVNPDRPKWVDPPHPTTEEKIAAADGTFGMRLT